MRLRGDFWLLILSLLLAGLPARASGELLGLRTVVDRQATTFVLKLPTPVEYTPTRIGSNLFVVDIAGVSTSRSSESQPVQSPLVSGYRLLNYQGADSQPHLALEITLKGQAEVKPVASPEGLLVRIENAATAAGATPAATRTSIREVSVVQAEGGAALEVEIVGDSHLQYKTLQLSNPERLVVDIPNSINRIRQRHLEVNTPPLRSVRVGQLRRQPPISRVVMDLDFKTPFQIRRESNTLLVSLGAAQASPLAPETSANSLMPTEALEPVEMTKASEVTPPVAEPTGNESPTVESPAAEMAADPAAEPSLVPPAAGRPSEEPILIASNQPRVPVPTASSAASPMIPVVPEAAKRRETAPAAENSVAADAKADPASAAPAAVGSEDVQVLPEKTPLLPNAAAKTLPEPAGDPRASGSNPITAEEPILLAQQRAMPPTLMAAQATQAQAPTYTGEPISVNLKDVDLKDFFRLVHEISGLNLVLDPNVSGVVTIVLDEVPWDQAMDIVLRNNGLGKELMGNVVRIARLSTLQAEEEQRRDLAAAIEQGQPRQTVTRMLSYARAQDLIPMLKRFLSARGDLVADTRTNMLIITDIPNVITQLDGLIGTLDRKSQQVEIEARVVAASRSFARDIGVQLAASGSSGNIVLGGTGLVGTSSINRGVTPPLFIGTPPDDPSKFANLPQPLASNLGAVGATSGMSFVLTAGSNFALDAVITAAESRGVGKLLSRPKIITQNNVEAMVQQGVRIPIQTTINNTISIQFVNVVLRLTVTPQITAEGTIFLKTDVENSTIDPGIARIQGIPALNTQQATTQVLVTNGGTVFFGGVMQTTNNLTEQQVPLLGSIPLVGNLFKRKATSSTTNELLFFITPKIVQS